jgi:L-ascorbate metabolism protein UlaG (beta-lactamase superfamily)
LENINCETALQSNRNQIIWLGHATFFIQLNGIRIITDPCLGNIFTTRRKVKLPCSIESLVNIEYCLFSHNHRDHFDVPSIRKLAALNPDCTYLTPLGYEPILQKIGVKKFQTASWYRQFKSTNDVEITLLPANHWCKRNGPDYNTMLWGSFWIKHNRTSVYFAGDTAAGTHFDEIRTIMGPPSIALMPIGAYKPEYLMQAHHLDPREAIIAANQLDAQVMVPMHYGTYDLSDEPPGEPIRWIRESVAQNKLTNAFKELSIGETLPLPDSPE